VRRFEEFTDTFYALGHQLLWGFLVAVSFCVSVVYEGRGQVFEQRMALTGCAFLAILLLGSLVRGRRVRRRKR
jgi:hypothetical protein